MKLSFFRASKRIYADAAAATPLAPRAQKEMRRAEALFGNPSGLHKEGVAAKKALERARERVARAIGAHADEIIFTSGGTESNNLAIGGVLRPLLRTHGQLHTVTTAIEHASVLEPLRALEREGLRVSYVPVQHNGLVEESDLRKMLNEKTVLVSIQLVQSEIGTIQHIRELAREVRHFKKLRAQGLPLYFHCDASQAPLWLPVRVEKLGVDLLTLDAQKMMGPKGVGVLYVRRAAVLEPLLRGGGQERGLRSGTENVVLASACAAALEDAQAGAEERAARISHVRDMLWNDIQKELPGVVLNGPPLGRMRVANNLNISIPGLDGQMAVIALDAEGVAVSSRSACESESTEPSYVLKALGKSDAEAASAVRVTLLPDARVRDARTIANALAIVANRYRNVV